MTTLRTFALFCLPSAACCLFVIGCATHSPATQPSAAATEPAEPQLALDVPAWLGDLREVTERLNQLSKDLPGQTDSQQRELMVAVFADLSGALPALHGPERSGAFDEQIRAIESTQRQLAGGSATLAFEPTIDYGLRAAYLALRDIQRANFSERVDLPAMLDQLQRDLDQLDVQVGPLHRVVEANAVGDMAKMVQMMDDVINQRMGTPAAGTPASGTSAPATAPATRPESAAL